ncbi:MAG: hypothetical protein EOM91_10795 [Sphingobacteriia bacterium]|nr:hypothetical protein [Sphingobacteriia bacterium]NCC39992.1 hypothetical protein [Gammaproteobacteria bacterium]
MAYKKLLDKLRQFLAADQAAQRKELDSIRKVTKKLKSKARELGAKLEETLPGEEHAEIAAKLEIIEAQRSKALKLIRELRSGRDQEKAERPPGS